MSTITECLNTRHFTAKDDAQLKMAIKTAGYCTLSQRVHSTSMQHGCITVYIRCRVTMQQMSIAERDQNAGEGA